jgi:hypothetical protein
VHWGRLDAMTVPGEHLEFGDELLLRYLYRDGTVQAALPLRVVEDSPGRIVAWLADGTDIMNWALADGVDPRSVPLEDRFSRGLTTAPRKWTGGGVLRVIPAARVPQSVDTWIAPSSWKAACFGVSGVGGRVSTPGRGLRGSVSPAQRGFSAVMRGGGATLQAERMAR